MAISDAGHTIASIITNPDKAAGRGQSLTPNELAVWASQENYLVAKPKDSSELNRHLLEVQPQVVVTVAYGRLIPVELLHGPRFGWINLHYSLLPAYRGAAPVQWAILDGATKTGLTIFKLDKGMDTGPIYSQTEIEILPEDTTDTLLHQLSQLGAQSIVDLLSVIGKTKTKPQPLSGISLAPKIPKEMGRIDWSQESELILRKARALQTRPGIYSTFQGKKIALFDLSHIQSGVDLTKPGSILSSDEGLIVKTSDGELVIREVTLAGSKRMSARDFARGARLTSDSSFE